MGIEGFYKWIKDEYSDSIYNIDSDEIPKYFNHVYVDLNYLLHMCSYNSNNMTHTINKLKNILLDITIKTQPTISLNLFCDGVAPMAKLLEQRKRRLESLDVIDEDSNIDNSTLNFTPGTIFLETLEDKLKQIINIIKNQLVIDTHIDIIGDGEGELKIKNKLLENYAKSDSDTHVLVTTDADVILMAMANPSYKNTFILLKDTILSLDKLLCQHKKLYLCGNYSNLDFSFLNLFLGNDYIPKLKFISNEKLWLAYKKNIDKYKYLIDNNNNIQYDFLIDILTDIIAQIKLCFYKKISFKDYDVDKIENYLNGIFWTYLMYKNGKCLDYKYKYNYDDSIDPLNLQLYLLAKKTNKQTMSLNINDNIINRNLCAILLLPKRACILINEKYHKFIENIDELYQEEKCSLCKKYLKTYKDNKKKLENENITKEEYKSFYNIYSSHKKTHKNLSYEDIILMVNKFNTYIKEN